MMIAWCTIPVILSMTSQLVGSIIIKLCTDQAVNPVCGTDGATYRNLCEVSITKMTYPELDIVHRGPCTPRTNLRNTNPLSSGKRDEELNKKRSKATQTIVRIKIYPFKFKQLALPAVFFTLSKVLKYLVPKAVKDIVTDTMKDIAQDIANELNKATEPIQRAVIDIFNKKKKIVGKYLGEHNVRKAERVFSDVLNLIVYF